MRHMRHFSEDGFTIVELTVVMVIIAMVVGVFSQMLISANQSASISRARVDINRSLHNAMDAIETDVRQALRFKVSTYDGYDTFAKDSWYPGGVRRYNKKTLILLQHATNVSSGSDSREIVYLKTPGFDCTTNKIQQPTYKRVVFYTLEYRQLMRRTVYNELIDAHGNPYTGTPANYFCMNDGEARRFKWRATRRYEYSILATDVSEFKVDYYEGDTLLAGQDSPLSAPKNLLDAADSVKVTLKIESKDGRISDSQTLMIRKTNNL